MKYLFILGNGFSLDLLNHLGLNGSIPLTNLAAYGDKLSWPTGSHSAFISFRNTPNLWILGVRPSNSGQINGQIIENVITCANAYYLKTPSSRSFRKSNKGSIYIDAYRELVVYLKYLFVSFDKEVEITYEKIKDWPWAKLFLDLNKSEEVNEVDIVTFNYDVWLERTLEALRVPYNVTVISSSEPENFSVTKPHGSISFIHEKHLDSSAFSINYDSDYLEGEAKDFKICMSGLEQNTPIIPLIPPAGDSDRFNLTWAGKIRSKAMQKAESLGEGDRVVICGLSYWHVDRREIDDLLLRVSAEAEIALVNPSPPETFDAVLTSLFMRYEHYTSIDRYLGGTNNV